MFFKPLIFIKIKIYYIFIYKYIFTFSHFSSTISLSLKPPLSLSLHDYRSSRSYHISVSFQLFTSSFSLCSHSIAGFLGFFYSRCSLSSVTVRASMSSAPSSSSSSMVCYNSECKELKPERPRKGWRLRTGELAELCDRCA